ncbi:MAG: hypothetical protein RLZZ387_15 [Chloroflexota bacterium]|jgi:hypothetical protein
MPALYQINPLINLIYYVGFGHCTGQELFAVEQLAREDPLRQPQMLILIDVSDVLELDIELMDYRSMVQLNQQLVGQGHTLEHTAIVIRKAHDQIVADTYQDMVEHVAPVSMATFFSRREALAWLGVVNGDQIVQEMKQRLHEQYKARR